MPSSRSPVRLALSVGLPLLLLDVITKRLVVVHLRPGASHEVLGEWFRFTLVYNRRAAMGLSLGEWSRWGFALIAILGTGLLWRLLRRTRPGQRLRATAIGLVMAGAIGNLIDRLRWSRGVVDLFDAGIGDTRFWIFNVADIGVSVGAVLLAYVLSKEESREARVESRE